MREINDPLFSENLLISKDRISPLVIVGLPRSGSSYLSELVSRIENWYVFDDLYTEHHAHLIGARGNMSHAQLDEMLYWLGWQIRARLRNSKYALPNVTENEIEAMNKALRKAFNNRPTDWLDIQEEWMRRLAARKQAFCWGYKLPSAFRSIDTILDRHPDAKFLFILRNPQEILASYKYMPKGHKDGDPRNYHPVFYALYWRMALQSYNKATARLGDNLMLVRFSELTSNPLGTTECVASFLGSQINPKYFSAENKANSSFDSDRKTINGLEAFILRSIAGKEAARIGFHIDQPKIHFHDFVELLAVTGRFALYRLFRFVSQRREVRGRIKSSQS